MRDNHAHDDAGDEGQYPGDDDGGFSVHASPRGAQPGPEWKLSRPRLITVAAFPLRVNASPVTISRVG
jgi:hypothetical protein